MSTFLINTKTAATWVGSFVLVLFFLAAQAQEINNLQHPDWYKPTSIGGLGDVLTIGTGKQHLVLLTGMGFDHGIFTEFMMRNADQFTCHAFTAAGMGNTIAPPIPDQQRYGDRLWSSAFEKAVLAYLDSNQIHQASVLGFFSGGVLHAIHLVSQDPNRFQRLILVSGELYRIGGEEHDLDSRSKQIGGMAQHWFKTVDRKTWYGGMFEPAIYSRDSLLAQRLWEIPNLPSIPASIQYLAEFTADNPSQKLSELEIPILVVLPEFSEAYLAIEGNDFIQQTFIESWYTFSKRHPELNLVIETVPDSQCFVFYDNAEVFQELLLDFIR